MTSSEQIHFQLVILFLHITLIAVAAVFVGIRLAVNLNLKFECFLFNCTLGIKFLSIEPLVICWLLSEYRGSVYLSQCIDEFIALCFDEDCIKTYCT